MEDRIFEAVSEQAQRLGISRSQFFATAAERYLRELEAQATTDKLNEIYGPLGGEDPETAEFRREAVRRAVERSEW